MKNSFTLIALIFVGLSFMQAPSQIPDEDRWDFIYLTSTGEGRGSELKWDISGARHMANGSHTKFMWRWGMGPMNLESWAEELGGLSAERAEVMFNNFLVSVLGENAATETIVEDASEKFFWSNLEHVIIGELIMQGWEPFSCDLLKQRISDQTASVNVYAFKRKS
jgi:hypothetical protein